MVIDVYFPLSLSLSLSKEKLKKYDSTCDTPQPNICIISYRGTCLLGALHIELPHWCNAQSVYYIRYVASNSNKEFRDIDLK
ncbi:hypothetical protein Lal_00011093 [Lupinus albus]|nr:hypothetical protein Lal_00011093 [Lupinus albus]